MKKSNYFKTIAITLFITVLTSNLSTFGQVSSNPHQGGLNQLYFGDFIELQKNTATRELKPGDYQGSPYLINVFLDGHIIMNDTVQYNNVPLRYNIYNEQIEYKISDTSYLAIFSPEKITEVVIDGRKFIYADKEKRRRQTKGFYEVLYDGQLQLLVKHYIDYKYEEKALGYNPGKPARFTRRTDTYHLKTSDEALPVKITSKAQFKTVFNTIYNYIEQNDLSLNKEDDLIQIARYMDAFNTLSQNPTGLPTTTEQKILELEQEIQLLEEQTKSLDSQLQFFQQKSQILDKLIGLIEEEYGITISRN